MSELLHELEVTHITTNGRGSVLGAAYSSRKGLMESFSGLGAAITVLQLMRRPLETSYDINDWPPLDSEEHLYIDQSLPAAPSFLA